MSAKTPPKNKKKGLWDRQQRSNGAAEKGAGVIHRRDFTLAVFGYVEST